MKNLIVSLFAIALCSCSVIDENERFVELPQTEVNRAVLIEDFTGQSCVNCPEASAIIHELEEQYGDDAIVAIGIYSGPLGEPESATAINLVTQLGQTYWDAWFDIQTAQPVGLINRQGPLDKEVWKRQVAEMIEQPTQVSIQAETDYDAESRTLKIHTSTTGFASMSGRLQVVLVEDSIVGYQKVLGSSKPNRQYVHNHVLRAAVNGEWGETMSIGTSAQDRDYTFVFPDEWIAENMQVVVFFTTENKKEVLQVKKIKACER